VPLDKEIQYIRNYIDLQKLRFKNPDYICFTVTGNTDGIMFPPLLLIHFIENAFKHGSKSGAGPGIIFTLVIEDHQISFEASNYLPPDCPEMITEGKGIKNIRRRLDLLFDKKYKLEIGYKKQMFVVHLELKDFMVPGQENQR
jgi:two-component system, LytTR family, sensor kinase